MHIMDGILPITHTLAYDAVSGTAVAMGIRKYQKESIGKLNFKILCGVFTAFIFIVTIFEIPMPFGSTEHPTGTPLAAIFLGPFITPFLSTVVLLLELLFKEGGVLSMGANVFSLGIIGSLSGWGLFFLLRRLRAGIFIAGFFAGFIGDLCVYLSTASQLALGSPGGKSFMYYLLFFVPGQVPLAILEGLFTGMVLKFIMLRRPDMLREFRIIP